jgi:spore cortex formation protein SpoVR/YcgB (stage V sporulation)
MDIGLDDNFDVSLDHLNNLNVVTGREAFEQRLRVRLTTYYTELIGQNLDENVLSLVRLEARRMVADEEGLEKIDGVVISRSDLSPNVLEVRIVYTTGEEFSTTLSE